MEKIELILSEMDNSEIIDVQSKEFGYKDYDVDTLIKLANKNEARYGFILEREDLEALMLDPGFSLSWVAKNEGLEVFGGFNFIGLPASICMDKYRVKLYNDDIEETVKKLILKSGYFDIMPGLESQVATVAIVNEESKKIELWYMDHFKMTKMNLSVGEYFDALFLTKGMYHWQYLFCDSKDRNKIEIQTKSYIDRMIDFLPKAFPNREYTTLIDKHKLLLSN